MEKICKNCEHFVQRSLDKGRYLSACQKSAGSIKKMDGDKEVVFKWTDDTCPDFKPGQEREIAGHRNNRNR
jgi:hypothetical protein